MRLYVRLASTGDGSTVCLDHSCFLLTFFLVNGYMRKASGRGLVGQVEWAFPFRYLLQMCQWSRLLE